MSIKIDSKWVQKFQSLHWLKRSSQWERTESIQNFIETIKSASSESVTRAEKTSWRWRWRRQNRTWWRNETFKRTFHCLCWRRLSGRDQQKTATTTFCTWPGSPSTLSTSGEAESCSTTTAAAGGDSNPVHGTTALASWCSAWMLALYYDAAWIAANRRRSCSRCC